VTDVENAASCPYEGESEVRSLYLAGKLPDKEAEAFEAHFFACERCAEAVEVGEKLRSAFGNVPVRAAAPPARARRTWLPLAAAAAVALCAIGVWQISRPVVDEREQPALRGGSATALVLQVEIGPEKDIMVSWPSYPGASAYEVQVFAADGSVVWSAEARQPRMQIRSGVLPSFGPDRPLTVEVRAFDALGREIATSDSKPVPSPK
jgi:anti-sigma factor RsiW